jgi:hypothetical protein
VIINLYKFLGSFIKKKISIPLFSKIPISEKTQNIKNLNAALSKVFTGQKRIDDISTADRYNIDNDNMNEADFFNHLLKVFASEKTIEINVQEFICDSIRVLSNNFDTGIETTNIFNFNENIKQNLKTITFFNMLLYAFEFMFNYLRVENTYSVECNMSQEGVIINFVSILRNSKKYKFRHPAKYATECPNTQFLLFHCISLLAKQNNYLFTVLQNDSTFTFRFAPKTKLQSVKKR